MLNYEYWAPNSLASVIGRRRIQEADFQGSTSNGDPNLVQRHHLHGLRLRQKFETQDGVFRYLATDRGRRVTWEGMGKSPYACLHDRSANSLASCWLCFSSSSTLALNLQQRGQMNKF